MSWKKTITTVQGFREAWEKAKTSGDIDDALSNLHNGPDILTYFATYGESLMTGLELCEIYLEIVREEVASSKSGTFVVATKAYQIFVGHLYSEINVIIGVHPHLFLKNVEATNKLVQIIKEWLGLLISMQDVAYAETIVKSNQRYYDAHLQILANLATAVWGNRQKNNYYWVLGEGIVNFKKEIADCLLDKLNTIHDLVIKIGILDAIDPLKSLIVQRMETTHIIDSIINALGLSDIPSDEYEKWLVANLDNAKFPVIVEIFIRCDVVIQNALVVLLKLMAVRQQKS